MIRGLYTAASGMASQLTVQEVISNNLANVDTAGFKKDICLKSSFSQLLLNRVGDVADKGTSPAVGVLGTGAKVVGTATDFSDGTLRFTDSMLDAAIAGDGFFVVQTPQGERYTRDGSFSVNAEGTLVTKDGYAVLGKRGSIIVDGSSQVRINEDGSVAINGAIANELRIVAAQDENALTKVGDNLYTQSADAVVSDVQNPRVLQGYLETSNVNAVSEMVQMMSGLRVYETSQRMISLQDEALDKLINDFGRV